MIEVFIYENQQLLESLEEILLQGEKDQMLTDAQINEIFRIMHTIKGASAMMSFDELAKISHTVEDLFSQIREKKARSSDWSKIFDIVLLAADQIKADMDRIGAGQDPVSDSAELAKKVEDYLELLTHRVPPKEEDEEEEELEGPPYYKVKFNFEAGCQMESLRAFGVVNDLNPLAVKLCHVPEDLMVDGVSEIIEKQGCTVFMQSEENPDVIKKTVEAAVFLDACSVLLITHEDDLPEAIRPPKKAPKKEDAQKASKPAQAADAVSTKQNFISVNVNKVDKLLDLVGEIVTTESMVTKNPAIDGLRIESFERASQQLRKLINELQDIVMSVRMLPVSTTFQKMNRLVRDMGKKVNKEVDLTIIGEETEVDKNIIDHLSDPLMHLIRNAVDHGLETAEGRKEAGKSPRGQLLLEARNTGGDVIITISDDGKGLNRDVLIQKAIDKGLTDKRPADISDKEAFSFIFMPGFSTKEAVTEFSGRGVGMDVVRQNIEKVGGAVAVESVFGKGTTFSIRIPLTLAIMDGMKLSLGGQTFIVPMLTIQESLKPEPGDVFLDPDGNEMIVLRGECYSVLRLHQVFQMEPEAHDPADGILIRVTNDAATFCLLADHLLGEQQVVVKPLPAYLQKSCSDALAGCAILGDGSISLIIDINSLISSGT